MPQRRTLVVVPAYGRDYQTEAEAQADWDKNMDFRIDDLFEHGYVSKSDCPAHITLQVRYNKLRDVFMIPATESN